ncbi:DUF4132 domain-containing protein [Actinoplanes sp. CA-252034]|uniref:DUF4132 domain-containing protein n=1 Tax=Actinoplanes sp. CA-252034 TaxID=3239906 RepID=UPI003D9539D2
MGDSGYESVFELPRAWLRHRRPRRGSTGVPAFTPDPRARELIARLLADQPATVPWVLDRPATEAPLRAAGQAWQAGDAGAPPAGAGAVAAITEFYRRGNDDDIGLFADLWISERGLPFAAPAAVELASMLVVDDTLPANQRHLPSRDVGVRYLRPGETRPGYFADLPLLVLLRVRDALVAAPETEFQQVVASLEAYRTRSAYARVACSVLVPRADRVEEEVAAVVADADGPRAAMLFYAACTGEQAATLAKVADAWMLLRRPSALVAVAEALGGEAGPALFHWADQDASAVLGVEGRRWVLEVLSTLPSDPVMRGLVARITDRDVRPALIEAAGRFPERALRILAAATSTPAVAEMLRVHVLTNRDLVDRVLPGLAAEAADRIRAVLAEADSVVTAPLSRVPPVLADPPWSRRRAKPAKPPVVTGLSCPDAASVAWLPGEREQWAVTPVRFHQDVPADWTQVAAKVTAGSACWWEQAQLFTLAPEEIARPLLEHWRPWQLWDFDTWIRLTAAKYETGALPALLTVAEGKPADYGPLLLPFASPRVAELVADWLARLKSMRRLAQTWLARHPAAAARALIPAAVGPAGPARRHAERALRHLPADEVRTAAAGYGPHAAAAVETLLTADPLLATPARMPSSPSWAAPVLLPPVRLRDGSGALPTEAAAHLVGILMISRPEDPYAGLEMVREAVEPADLAVFGWALFELWQSAGAPAKESWVLHALGLTGDDETVRRLSPMILAWPGDGGHAKAVSGLTVLATIGSGVALMHLHRISQRARFKGLKTAAVARIEEVAAGLGLTAEQLADRLVPDFGLDADGSLRLDYGPRRFVVGFDEQLRPFVTDDTGRRLKSLPKPGAEGDGAYRRFSALKKDVRTVATDLVRRLEQAMVTGRRWSGAEFREYLLGHPLLWHIVRRLVWARFDEAGAVTGTLRVAEDRSLAGVDDEVTGLADDDVIGVAHPLHLGDATAAWSEVFADYQILQPFPQLGRPVFALTEQEADASHLTRFQGITVPTTRLLGLERRGWRRSSPQEGGMQVYVERTVAPGRVVSIELDPGIVVGEVGIFADQRLTTVSLSGIGGSGIGGSGGSGSGSGGSGGSGSGGSGSGSSGWDRPGRGRLRLGDLDPITVSEILLDLTEVAG